MSYYTISYIFFDCESTSKIYSLSLSHLAFTQNNKKKKTRHDRLNLTPRKNKNFIGLETCLGDSDMKSSHLFAELNQICMLQSEFESQPCGIVLYAWVGVRSKFLTDQQSVRLTLKMREVTGIQPFPKVDVWKLLTSVNKHLEILKEKASTINRHENWSEFWFSKKLRIANREQTVVVAIIKIFKRCLTYPREGLFWAFRSGFPPFTVDDWNLRIQRLLANLQI